MGILKTTRFLISSGAFVCCKLFLLHVEPAVKQREKVPVIKAVDFGNGTGDNIIMCNRDDDW